MKIKHISCLLALCLSAMSAWAQDLNRYVNPFIGTTNFGTTNPGPVCPNGMMSVSPFNVMGSELNKYDKDARWWSTPYTSDNKYFTGYSHVNLSGVGCPDMGSLLLMPITGKLNTDYKTYGSTYTAEKAEPGYYTNRLDKYGIKTEVTTTMRSSIARFTFPKGEAHILLNLGEGLTNESGAWVRRVSETEIEGMKLLGTFCYNAQAVFPIYFVMRVSRKPQTTGYWKQQRPMTAEAAWDNTAGTRKLYTRYHKQLAGDDIGAYFSYELDREETIDVQMGVSFVSTENARLNLEKEQQGKDFEKVRKEAYSAWQKTLSCITVEGGTEDQKTVFYTALYHAFIHPNVLNDVNGQYPAMESDRILTSDTPRYTVFSLWDTYRNLHQLVTLLQPEKQTHMLRSMVEMYKESGWMPKWELYSRETETMEGDPAIPVIADSWLKGLKDFDIKTAYQGMVKSATTAGAQNRLRPDNDDYLHKGFVPLREKHDNSVSHALEYYIADYALGTLAESLGHAADAKKFKRQALNYKKYYSSADGTFRPLLPDGTFLKPFSPMQGANFEEVPGFHEGTAWNYSFMVPHDIKGLIRMHGGEKQFVNKLQKFFDAGHYDVTNEPNIAYPYLFNHVKGEQWRTQKLTRAILDRHFKNANDGLPGNDDTGTMSAWALFSMMGLYPDRPAYPAYAVTDPVFDKILLHLDTRYYPSGQVVIQKQNTDKNHPYIRSVIIDGKPQNAFFISHKQLTNAHSIILQY